MSTSRLPRACVLPLLAPLVLAPALRAGDPPPTEARPVTERLHGETIVDPYRWLEPLEAESGEVKAWTDAQNEHTRSILDAIPGRDALEERLAELMQVGTVSAPTVRGDRFFNREREGDQNQSVLYLREGADGAKRVLLDPNTLDDAGLYALDWYEPDPAGERMAFGLSYAGDEMTVLYVMDVATGDWLADEIPGKTDFGGWAPDGSGFLYGVLEDPTDAYSRAWKYHELGRHHRQDPTVFRQDDPSVIPGALLSRDGRWIVLQKFRGWARQDVHAVRTADWLADPEAPVDWITVAEGIDARFAPQMMLAADGADVADVLVLFTTWQAPNGRLVAVDLNDPAAASWTELVNEQPNRVLLGASEADGFIVCSWEQDATSRFTIHGTDGSFLDELPTPGLGTASIATEHDRREVFLTYQSFNEPLSIYRMRPLETRSARDLWERPEVPVDPDLVTVSQVWATSKDGTKVPMFLVHRTDLEPTGDVPTLMYGYGGFDISITPRFRATDFPFLEAGGLYVSVNLRGGGEYGEAWHRGGMLDRKQNVFDDLYAAAEHLIETGWTTSEHIAVLGGSNGGLLTGVAATQRPDLFAAAVSAVPLLDMIRFPKFLMARFWIPEYGDPEDPEAFRWIRAYSPYHNVESGVAYPAMLITAGENDNRVHPMHARKMAALLQARAANDHAEDPILLWVDRDAGHGAGKPLSLRIRDAADRWAFVMWQTGLPLDRAAGSS